MIDSITFARELYERGTRFVAGVPCSLLGDLCNELSNGKLPLRHVAAANEGTAVAIACGHYLATGSTPVIYLQNSGIGNAINPLVSLAHPSVSGIPLILFIGWRGEAGGADEPQHQLQGAATLPLLSELGVSHDILSTEPREALLQVERASNHANTCYASFALVVRKGTFSKARRENALSHGVLTRGEVVACVLNAAADGSVIVSSTGYISREVEAHRRKVKRSSARDFLVIGAMGHASQVALGIALEHPQLPVICLDGDGAMLMHLGGVATIGAHAAPNLLHIVLNNRSHDSVGGMPTCAPSCSFTQVATACGYPHARLVHDLDTLTAEISAAPIRLATTLIEVSIASSGDPDLPRPAVSPRERAVQFRCAMANAFEH